MIKTLAALFPAFLCAACAQSGSRATPGRADVVASLGEAVLTAADIRAALPAGLSSDDSVRFVRAYVNTWIDSRLITDIAAREVDMSQITPLVEEYRSRLIMQQYTRRMFETHAAAIPDDSLRTYYDRHSSEFSLERPLVRGVYIKVPDDSPALRDLRRLYRSDRPDDIDRLEKEVLRGATHYDYFRDRWVDWEQIETRIPADFGADPATWAASGRTLDISAGGYTYLLRITDILPAGRPMPFESARPLIVQRLLASGRRAYEAELLRDLRSRATADGTLHIALP